MQTQELTDSDVEREMFTIIDAFYDQEPPCEVAHERSKDNPVCSGKVVGYVSVACRRTMQNVCQNTVDTLQRLYDQQVTCKDCERPAFECWVFHPRED